MTVCSSLKVLPSGCVPAGAFSARFFRSSDARPVDAKRPARTQRRRQAPNFTDSAIALPKKHMAVAAAM